MIWLIIFQKAILMAKWDCLNPRFVNQLTSLQLQKSMTLFECKLKMRKWNKIGLLLVDFQDLFSKKESPPGAGQNGKHYGDDFADRFKTTDFEQTVGYGTRSRWK